MNPTATAPKNSLLFSRSDETFYQNLAQNTDLSARDIWRIRRTRPILATGRISDMANRLYLVPSTRTLDLDYQVDLGKGECFRTSDGEECPNLKYGKGSGCVHIRAGLEAERVLMGANQGNELMDAPAGRRAA